MNVSALLRSALRLGKKCAPMIMMAAGTYLAVDAIVKTPAAYEEANDLIVEEERELGRELTLQEKVKVAYKPWLGVVAREGGSLFFFYYTFFKTHKAGASIAAAYALLRQENNELDTMLREKLGQNKYEEAMHERMNSKIEKAIERYGDQISEGDSDALGVYYEPYTGKIFKADPRKIEKVMKDLDEKYGYEGYVTLSEFFKKLNIDPPRVADYIGWWYSEGSDRHIRYKTYDYHWKDKDLYITGLDMGLKLEDFIRTWW